ncbi:hypothetical protein [Selenomonas artemidis]|uniref:hypothetical protein n=1 Tax=Selenomonas artemidis TaxID=671224 RepID=UPI0008FBC478|nr:hypothetical protein [Selenomonas artemidis]
MNPEGAARHVLYQYGAVLECRFAVRSAQRKRLCGIIYYKTTPSLPRRLRSGEKDALSRA